MLYTKKSLFIFVNISQTDLSGKIKKLKKTQVNKISVGAKNCFTRY